MELVVTPPPTPQKSLTPNALGEATDVDRGPHPALIVVYSRYDPPPRSLSYTHCPRDGARHDDMRQPRYRAIRVVFRAYRSTRRSSPDATTRCNRHSSMVRGAIGSMEKDPRRRRTSCGNTDCPKCAIAPRLIVQSHPCLILEGPRNSPTKCSTMFVDGVAICYHGSFNDVIVRHDG